MAITCLQWDVKGVRLFFGDEVGAITLLAIPLNPRRTPAGFLERKSSTTGLNLVPPKILGTRFFLRDGEVIFRGDTRIVQLDYCRGKLLVSTLTRMHILCTVREQVHQIGSQPRDGHFGACFGSVGATPSVAVVGAGLFSDTDIDGSFPPIFACRPRGRVWKADAIEAVVTATLNFKAEVNVPSCEMLKTPAPIAKHVPVPPGKPRNFRDLQHVSDGYMLSWYPDRIYILDSTRAKLLGWYAEYQDIISLCVYGQDIYILQDSGQGNIITHATLLSPGDRIAYFLRNERYVEATRALISYCHAAATIDQVIIRGEKRRGEKRRGEKRREEKRRGEKRRGEERREEERRGEVAKISEIVAAK